MKLKAKFDWISVAVCALLSLSLPAFARAANPPQDQGTAQTQSAQKDKNEKAATSPGKEVGTGGEDVGKGAAKGAGSLGKGSAGAAGNLVTLHPGNAAADLGKGAAGAGKDVGVGTGKGTVKMGKGLKLTVSFEATPEGGISPQKIEETKAALQELGLSSNIETT